MISEQKSAWALHFVWEINWEEFLMEDTLVMAQIMRLSKMDV
jgi:hypothetical protein